MRGGCGEAVLGKKRLMRGRDGWRDSDKKEEKTKIEYEK